MPLSPLTFTRHAKARLRSQADMHHAASQNHARIGLSEVDQAAADYPLFLLKHAQTGRFSLCALFALEGGQSWYWLQGGWQATYLPEALLRHPFFLAPDDPDAVLGLAVEEASNRLHDQEGASLFTPDGQPTQTTRNVAAQLSRHRSDLGAADGFVAALQANELIRPLNLLLRLADGRESQVEGLYGIDPEGLADLPEQGVMGLHRTGYLRAAHVMMASTNQLYRLQQLHNAAHANRLVNLTFAIRAPLGL